jgi:AraC family transcriptional regulator of adaptative response/methylated-DNA-[protein]-cysteine methyltransferase
MESGEIVYRRHNGPLGPMVAGVTGKGCCLVEFEDRGGLPSILGRLRRLYRCEVRPGTSPILEQLLSELERYFDGARDGFTVPLDLRGTPFQMSVWDRLLEIPYGETRSYGEIAGRAGHPRAVRAVGRANGSNLAVIVVPCHRVIRSDGDLGGYGAGVWRKKRLLALEGVPSGGLWSLAGRRATGP